MSYTYCEQSQQILENMSDSFFAVDSEWRIVYANKRAQWSWQKKRSELIGFVLWDLFPGYRQIKGSQELIRAMVNRTPVSFETFSLYLKSYVETDAFPTQTGGLEVYFRNITDRKHAMETQQTTDQMLHLAIDATGIGFWKWDFISDQMSTIYSSPNMPEKWHNKSVAESLQGVHPEDHDRMYAELQQAKQNRRQYRCEYRRILNDESTVWILAEGVVVLDNAGVPYMLGINYDITNRKNVEMQEQLMKDAQDSIQREKELLEILDGASDGSWVIDVQNHLIFYSRKWKLLRGTEHLSPKEEFDSDACTIHSDDRERIRSIVNAAFASRMERCESEYRIKTAKGSYIWVLARIKITYDGNGRPVKMYGAGTDITKRKELELQLQEKNQLIIDFFANISHEFKTPLAIILLAIDLINVHFGQANCQFKNKIQYDISVVKQNVHRMLKLISNLLDLTKIDAGFMTERLQRTDITKTIRDLVDSVKCFAQDKGISVQYAESCDVHDVSLDNEKLERIVLNLLSNAIKHTQMNGQISVSLQTDHTRILIAVCDNGEGIPEDKQAIIFERFRRVNTTMTRDCDGCGIGLSLSKALVELMNGRIWLNSTPGKGSTFFVELPVVEAKEGAENLVVEGLPVQKKVEMEFSDIFLV